MSAPAWMPLYVADYLADTGHLTMAEHGAYILLIMHYWQNGALPDDEKKIARICRASHREWETIRDTMADLFAENWRHKRIDEELARAEAIWDKRRAAGRASADIRASKRSTSAPTLVEHMGQQKGNQPQPHTPEETPSLRSGAKKARRLEADWQPSAEDLAYARSQGMPQGVIDREAENFRDYWAAKPGNGGLKLDWPATWRTWVRRTCQKAGYRPPALQANGHHGPSPPKDEADAIRRLEVGRQNRKWPSARWGPRPTLPGCLIPSQLLKPGDGDDWEEWT